jgi:myosin heavy subunit
VTNSKQFERRVEAVEKMIVDLQSRYRGLFYRYATDEELHILEEVRAAISNGRGLNGLSEELANKGLQAFARMSRRVKDRSRPQSRKLIPYFPAPTEAD